VKFSVPPTDVAGKIIEVGDTVAFCVAGRSSDMRLGKVMSIMKKQCSIEHTADAVWNGREYVPAEYPARTLRNFCNVAKV